MKKILIASAFSLAAIATASAADMAPKMYTKAPPPPPPVFSWTGFYIGGNLGGGWADASGTGTVSVPGVGTFIGSAGTTESGVIGGGQIGYNWQWTNVVFGVEADIDGSGERSTGSFTCPAATCGVALGTSVTNKVDAFGTVRGRLGFAFDRWMIYGTGGYAWQNINSSWTSSVAGVGSAAFSANSTRSGYAVGGGVETALWDNNWIAGLEYLYLDTGNFSTGGATIGLVGVPAGTTITGTGRVQNNIVRARLSYKF